MRNLIRKTGLTMQDETRGEQSTMNIVLTVPYVPVFDDKTRTKERGKLAISTFSRALDLALTIAPPSQVIVVLERKIKNYIATQGIRDLSSSRQCHLLLCDEFETVGRWYRGIRSAFDGNCETTLMLPGDIEKIADEEKFRTALRDMAIKTKANCLTVGDYSSTDPFKEKFDPCLSHPLLEAMFPAAWPAIHQAGIKKVRSEYFCIGAKAFHAFQEQGWRWLPLDVTMLLMIAVVSESGCELKRVDLGQVSDSATREADTAAQQILRFGFQVWFNGHHIAGKNAEAQKRLLTEKWWPIIEKATKELLACIQTER